MGVTNQNKRVLIIDDDEYFNVISRPIQNYGHTVELKLNLADALNALRNPDMKFDVVLLDLFMNGNDLPKQIKNIYRNNTGMSAGWAFYEYVLLEEYPLLAERTMIISGDKEGYEEWCLENRFELWSLLTRDKRVLSKNAPDIISKILKFIHPIHS